MITCDNMKVSDFITCWIDKDYSVFASDKIITDGDKEEEWNRLYKEYLQLTENLPVLKAIMLINELTFWRNELLIIDGCLSVLPSIREDSLVKLLREKGHRFDFNAKDIDAYRKDLHRVATRAKKMVADIKDLENQLTQLQTDNKGEEYTRQDFTNDLVCLSKFMGYHIDKDKCTVAEYVSMKNAIYHHNENINNGIKQSR